MTEFTPRNSLSKAPVSRSNKALSQKALEKSYALLGAGRDHSSNSNNQIPSSNEVIRFISREMILNIDSTVVKLIKILLSERDYDGTAKNVSQKSIDFFIACDKWKSMVQYDAPWDHKSDILEKFGPRSLLLGKMLQYDIWSNIHYGYVGRVCGFSEYVLLSGAGFAQAKKTGPMDGWVSRVFEVGLFRSFDDPRDQQVIEVGFEIFDNFGVEIGEKKIFRILCNRIDKL